MIINNNIPKLRFKEFTDSLEEKKIKEIIKSYRLGGNYSNSEKPTDFPLIKMGNIGRGNIITDKIEYISEGQDIDPADRIHINDLFFNTRNTLKLVGKVAIWRGELPVAYYNSNLLKLDFDCNLYMNYYFNSYNGLKYLRRLATGTTSVAAIYTRDLLGVKVNIPSPQEQQKIADFLGAVDERIELLEEKKKGIEKYKKGLMQKLFPKKDEINPELRFEKGNGESYPDWTSRSFTKIFKSIATKKYQIYNKQICNSGNYPVVDQGKELIAGYTNKNDKLFKNGPVVIFGDHTTFLKYIDFDFVVGADGTKIIQNKDNEHDLRFLYYSLLIVNIEPEGYRRHFSVLKKKSLQIPSSKEQKEIADFLSHIDNKINLINKRLKQVKQFKKALLQQMFV